MAEAPLLTYVTFQSELFPAYPGEEDETNPGRFGKRLAEFLVVGLRKAGITCKAPGPEDWGWRIDVQNEAFPLWIGIGVEDGSSESFICYVEPGEPVIRRFFKKIETRGPVEAVQKAMDAALKEEPGVRELRWQTKAEFES
jgi:hypothetical protein